VVILSGRRTSRRRVNYESRECISRLLGKIGLFILDRPQSASAGRDVDNFKKKNYSDIFFRAGGGGWGEEWRTSISKWGYNVGGIQQNENSRKGTLMGVGGVPSSKPEGSEGW